MAVLAAVGPLQDIWLGGRLQLTRAREAEKAAHRPPRKDPSLANLEPEIFSLLKAASRPRVFRLDKPRGSYGRHVVLGYPANLEIPINEEQWVREFVTKYVGMSRVGVVDPQPLTPILAVRLDVPGGSADILIGSRKGGSNSPLRFDSVGGMMMTVRTDAGIRTIEAYSPMFAGWPDPPDSAIQKLWLALGI
jgi:hypothetical protein